MKISIGSEIKIKDYDKEILDYCENNLKISNPDYFRAEAMGRWTGNIEPVLDLFVKNGDTLVVPYGCFYDIIQITKNKAEFEFEFEDIKRISLDGKIDLYPYQKIAMEKMLYEVNGILQAPCGSGKTQIALELVHQMGFKTLWITHTKDLLKQSKERCESYFKGDFGTITDGKINIGKDITFATIQTLNKIDLDKYKNEWSCIIVDECHRVAGSPTKMMQFYKVLSKLSAPRKFGLTATLKRSDGMVESTKALLGNIIYTISDNDVENNRMKATLENIEIETEPSEYYLESDGTFNYMRLGEYLANNKERNEIISNAIVRELMVGNSCLVLSTRLDHLKTLQYLVGEGEYIDGKTPKKKREQAIENMKSGKCKLLFATYSLAKEGLDIPILNRLFIAIPTKNYVTIKQSIGRIERKIEGKKQPIVFNFEDVNIPECKQMSKKIKAIVKK